MRVEQAVRTSQGTAANACLELIAGATKRLRLRRVEIFNNAATASVIGLGFPAAIGITPTTPVAGVCEANQTNGVYTVVGATALAWGTGPTVPATFIKRVSLAAAVGAGIKWEFDDDAQNGIYVPAAKSIILWVIATSSVLDVNLTWDE